MNNIDKKYIELLSSQLKNFKKSKDKYNFSCPLCGDSKSNERKARGWLLSLDKDKSITIFKCFNCGETKSLKHFLKHIDENLYKEYVAELYFTEGKTYSDNKKAINNNLNIITFNDFVNNENIISCIKMNNSSIYLRNRKITNLYLFYHTNNYGKLLESLKLEKYKDEYCFSEEKLVIPHFNRDNNLAFLQFRSLNPESKLRYKTYKILEDEDKIWNINNINLNKKYIYVTEGALDASFLDNAIAMSGADFTNKNSFISNNKSKIRIILDNEPRNIEIAKRYYKLAENDFKIFIWPNIKQKDINDCILAGLNLDMFYNENNYYSGLEGSIKLTDWIKVSI